MITSGNVAAAIAALAALGLLAVNTPSGSHAATRTQAEGTQGTDILVKDSPGADRPSALRDDAWSTSKFEIDVRVGLMRVSPSGDRLYVTDSLADAEEDEEGKILVLDSRSGAVLSRWKLDGDFKVDGDDIYDLEFSPDGSRLYVATDTLLLELDAHTGEVLRSNVVRAYGDIVDGRIEELLMAPGGDRLYLRMITAGVSYQTRPAPEVIAVDLDTLEVADFVSTPVSEFAISPDGTVLYALDPYTSFPRRTKLLVIDASSLTVTSEFAFQAALGPMVLSPDGHRVYVQSRNEDNNPEGDFRLLKIETETGAVVASWRSAINSRSLWINPAGDRLLARVDAGGIARVSTRTGQPEGMQTIDYPELWAIGPRADRLYVSQEYFEQDLSFDFTTIHVIDTTAIPNVALKLKCKKDGSSSRRGIACSVIARGIPEGHTLKAWWLLEGDRRWSTLMRDPFTLNAKGRVTFTAPSSAKRPLQVYVSGSLMRSNVVRIS